MRMLGHHYIQAVLAINRLTFYMERGCASPDDAENSLDKISKQLEAVDAKATKSAPSCTGRPAPRSVRSHSSRRSRGIRVEATQDSLSHLSGIGAAPRSGGVGRCLRFRAFRRFHFKVGYLPLVGISTHSRNRQTVDAVGAKIMKFNYEARKRIKLL